MPLSVRFSETFNVGERSPMNVLKMASHKDVS